MEHIKCGEGGGADTTAVFFIQRFFELSIISTPQLAIFQHAISDQRNQPKK